MNPVVPYLTPIPLQGETAAKNGRSTDLGFATLLDGVGSSQERVAYDVRDTDNRSAARDSTPPRETDRTREDQRARANDSDSRPTRASDQSGGAQSTASDRSSDRAANGNTDHTNSKSTTASDTPRESTKVESDGSAPSDGKLKTSETAIEAGTEATSAVPDDTPTAAVVKAAFDQPNGGVGPEQQQALATVTLAPTSRKAATANDAGASTAGSLPSQSLAPTSLLNQAAAASQNKSETATSPSASGRSTAGVLPAGSTVPDASAGAPAGASGPVTQEMSTQRSAQVQAQIVAPNTPTQVAPSQSIAAQIAGIAAEEKPQIKVTTDAQNGTPKSLTSPGLLALANTQNNSPGTNTGSANRGLTNGGATGGNATSADVLLNAQVAAEKEIFGAVVSATAAKIPADASPVATGATTSSAEVLPTTGTGFANSSAQPTSQIVTAPPAKAGTPTPSAAEQVGIHLTRAAQSGATRFTIQLHPAELGRVDVKMEVTHDGKIHAVVTADRQDTLDMLQRDARGLERALQSSGLKADSNSLSFSLRDQGGSSGTFAESGNSRPGAPLLENDEMTTPADIAALANQASGLGGADGRLNILV